MSSLGDLAHLDVYGLYNIPRDELRLFIMVVSDFTQYVRIYLLKIKDEFFENILVFF